MKQVIVLSGKGGTGKTSITAALAHLASAGRRLVLVDTDVDAANLGIVLRPEARRSHLFEGGKVATVDAVACEYCGECIEACRFGAIAEAGMVDTLSCDGCAACMHRCPAGAIGPEGHDKERCRHHFNVTLADWLHRDGYTGESLGCGLCQTCVPCEDCIP